MSPHPAPVDVQLDPGLDGSSETLPEYVIDWVESLPQHAVLAAITLLLDPTGTVVKGRWVLPNGIMIEVEKIRTSVPVSNAAMEALVASLERLNASIPHEELREAGEQENVAIPSQASA